MKGVRYSSRNRILIVYTLLVVSLWAVLFLPHLRKSPRWYGDETITIACGQDLVHGVFANRGTWNTYVNPQFCYQPGYVALMGAASLAGGRDILLPRFLNTLMALAIALMALWILAPRFSTTFALLAGMTFLAYLQTVIHFRWVYAHNVVAAGFFLCFASLCARETTRRTWLAGSGLAIAALCHPLVLHGGAAAFLSRWRSPRSWVPLFLPPLVAGLLVMAPVFLRYPEWFVEDLGHLAAFYRLYSQENASGFQILHNLAAFFLQDAFHLLAGPALLFSLFTRMRPIAIGAIVLVIALTGNRQNLPVFYYQAIVLLPLLSVSLAWAIWCLVRRISFKQKWVRWIPFFLPALLLTQSLFPALRGSLVSRNDPWVTRSVEEVEEVAAWVNEHTGPEDLVISHWNVGWLLRCRTADLLQSTAFAGFPTHTFEHHVPRERFRYDLSPASVKYLILADIDTRWTIFNPNVLRWLDLAGVSTWPIVYRSQNYSVVENPEQK